MHYSRKLCLTAKFTRFSSRSFMVLVLIFWYIIHLKLVFIYDVTVNSGQLILYKYAVIPAQF